jgi:hypothetical protein
VTFSDSGFASPLGATDASNGDVAAANATDRRQATNRRTRQRLGFEKPIVLNWIPSNVKQSTEKMAN